MSDAEKQEIIIVRRYENEEHHHGNTTWKVAHADFMTAMMAFFLIMWLINATDEKARSEIANYFNPIKLADNQLNKKGLNDPAESTTTGATEPGQKPTKGTRDLGPHPMTLGPLSGEAEPPPDLEAEIKRGDREKAVFRDPYAVLAEIAAEAKADGSPASADVMVGETGMSGASGGEVVRDPFDPVYWQTAPTAAQVASEAPTPGAGGAAGSAPPPENVEIDATKTAAPVAGLAGPTDATGAVLIATAAEAVGTAGDDTAAQGAAAMSAAAAAELAADLGEALQSVGQSPHLEVVGTSEGVLISLTDDINFSMFAIGSAVPDPQAVLALEKIGQVLAERSGEIIIRGHTDSRPFRSDTYDNWRLSTARAHMAYYMLVRGGIDEARIRKIEGFADRDPKNPDDPQAAINRRIEVILREPTA